MKITDEALFQFKSAISEHSSMGSAIRFFTATGCCGPSIQMDLVDQALPGDKLLSISEVDFYIESQAEQMLEEVTIDFKENNFRLEGLKKSGGCC